jgi:pectinesterase
MNMSASFFLSSVNRRVLLRAAFFAGANHLAACATLRTETYNAIVMTDIQTRGSVPAFPSIQAALDAAPANATRPYRILITKGRWREKLTIDKPFIHFVGEDRTLSRVDFDAYAGQIAPDGQLWGTSRTATITVRAADFSMSNLAIENTFDYPSYLSKSQGEPTGPNRSQAVALMLDSGSDRALIHQCNITGFQDTLFANVGRSVFRECRIAGTVDFIFGAGYAVFEDCEIVSRLRLAVGRQGYIAAPSTLLAQEHGLIFLRCRLTKEDRVPSNSVALGRAWRPTTAFADGRYGNPNAVGMAAYIGCWMGDHIIAEGWDAMEYGARDGSRASLQPEDARFYEYDSRGPGAASNARRHVLSSLQSQHFEMKKLLDGWHPSRL